MREKIISVVIPTHDRPFILGETLRALGSQDMHPDEIIVVEDGNQMQKPDEYYAGPACLILAHQDFHGFRAGQARNKGAHIARGEILIFLDDDMVVDSKFIREHIRQQRSCRAVVAGFRNRVTAKAYFGGDYRTACRRDPKLTYLGEGVGQAWPGWLWFSSSHFSISRDAFCEVGGFAEDFVGWGFEDTDFAYRAWRRGYLFRYMTESVPTHIDDPRTEQTSRLADYRKNAKQFMEKHNDPILRYVVLRHLWSKIVEESLKA
jgi:GT2 family glycosyltransferase